MCLYVCIVNRKWLELSASNSVRIYSTAVTRHTLTWRSRSHGYENHRGSMVASKVCWCCCHLETAWRMTAYVSSLSHVGWVCYCCCSDECSNLSVVGVLLACCCSTRLVIANHSRWWHLFWYAASFCRCCWQSCGARVLDLDPSPIFCGVVLRSLGWPGDVVVRASDTWSRGHEFDPRLRRYQVTTLGKFFTPMCLCYQAI